MAKEATLQVRMDSTLKEQVELLYKTLGTSFAEAVRIFAQQSVAENGMPFKVQLPKKNTFRLGIAKDKMIVPDDIDFCNDEIADLFGAC